MQKPLLWTKNFIIISLSNFFLFISFYILLVIMVPYSLVNFQVSQSEAGLAAGIFILGSVLVRPIVGRVINIVRKKKLLIISFFAFLVMNFFYFLVNDFEYLLLIRFAHGVTFGIATTTMGVIAVDVIPKLRRGEGMGYFLTSMNLAMAIGPFIGITVNQYFDGTMIFVTTIVFSFITLIISLSLKIPDTFKESEDQFDSNDKEKGFQLSNYFDKSAIPISMLIALMGFIYSSVITFLSSFAIEVDLVEIASFFFISYSAFLLISRPLTGKLFDNKGANSVIYPSILLFALGLFILSQSTNGITLLLAGAFIGVGFGTIQSSTLTIAVNKAPNYRVGVVTATFLVFIDFGLGVGPFLLGFLIPVLGYQGLYITMSVTALSSILLYYFIHGKNSKK